LRILLTFTGFHDPYSRGLIGEEDQPGPILSLLKARTFDAIYLLSTPNTEENTVGTLGVLAGHPNAQRVFAPLHDPTDYRAILKHLRSITCDIAERHPGAEYFVSVASGTPQMHACWVLLTASGDFPARILHVRPPRFVTADAPLVSEVDLDGAHFPVVRTRPSPIEAEEVREPDVQQVLGELGLVGDHPKVLSALNIAAVLAPSTAPVLILGATGTGKELVAKFIHRLSGRPLDRFVALNCAAIPKELAESVLFGPQRFRKSLLKVYCLGIGKVASPVPLQIKRANWSKPMAVRFSSTSSANYRWRPKPSCFGCWRTVWSTR
jgi:Sigma-54 interaction domain/Regulator of RNA terminal phosphate cyclase/CRISPR-associated protein (Cas_Csm6)